MIGVISSQLLLVTGFVGAAILFAGVWIWPDTCAQSDLPGEYVFLGKSGLIRLNLEPAGHGKLRIGERDVGSDLSWEFDKESENVFVNISGMRASVLRAELSRPEGRELQQSRNVLVGFGASCKFGQRKLYVERDSDTYFSLVRQAQKPTGPK